MVHDMPLVSIIVPAYNVENYICKTINSILQQTYTDLECIIVIDGATDNTEGTIKSLSLDHRFRIFKTKNNGASSARNLGINHSRGNLITFLDADDYWDPSFLEAMVKEMEQTDSDICFCACRVEANGNLIKGLTTKEPIEEHILLDYLKKNISIPTGSIVYKNKLLRENNLWFAPQCKRAEDTEFRIKALTLGKISFVNRELITIVSRSDSLTHSFDVDEIDVIKNVYLRSMDFISSSSFTLKERAMKIIKTSTMPFAVAQILYVGVSQGHSRAIRNELRRKAYFDIFCKFRPTSFWQFIIFYTMIISCYVPGFIIISKSFNKIHEAPP